MIIRPYIALVILTACVTSCGLVSPLVRSDSVNVAISNNTNTEKQIKVIFPPNFKFPGDDLGTNDSLTTYNLNIADNYLHPIKIPFSSWDITARTHSFTLKANHIAIVEHRWGLEGWPTYGQIFIIDNTDTVELKKNQNIFIKNLKGKLGGTWTYTIIDHK